MKPTQKNPRPQRLTLWRWICTRLLSLAIGSTVAIIAVLWLRYYLPTAWLAREMPEAEKAELAVLVEDPRADINRYHEIIDKWYGLEFSDPTVDDSDWALILLLILAATAIIIYLTLRTVRPISMHIAHLAQVARSVSKGDFGTKVEGSTPLPVELNGLTEDLNVMSGQLARYDRELKASHVALAHELRSPLTAAIGRLQGMIDGIFPPSPDQHAMVMRQLQHLNHLVDDLHLFSLAHAGQLHLSMQELRIDEAIKETVAWITPRLIEMDINVDIAGEGPLVCRADSFRIGQVILILLDNALRYAAEGKKIDIRYFSTDTDVCFDIKDYGHGVPDAYLREMFVRFSRAEGSRSRNSGGSGLGLSIAEAICHAHHGRIAVRKNASGGLTFTVSLPK